MISHTDILHILLKYASRGMGNQCDVITRYILKSFYTTPQKSSYRATVTRFLGGRSGLPRALSKAIKKPGCLSFFYNDLSRYLGLLPGVYARYKINAEVFNLVSRSNISSEAKNHLTAYYRPDTISVDEISIFVAHVLLYSFERYTSYCTHVA